MAKYKHRMACLHHRSLVVSSLAVIVLLVYSSSSSSSNNNKLSVVVGHNLGASVSAHVGQSSPAAASGSISAGDASAAHHKQPHPDDLPQSQATAAVSAVGPHQGAHNGGLEQARLRQFEEFRASKLFVAPFEAQVKYLPDEQVQFVRKTTETDLALFRQILNEAIESRNKWLPSGRLMLKYGAKLIGTFLRNRRAELKITNRYEPAKSFFTMLADLIQQGISKSEELKKERNYKKADIDVEAFRRRVEALFDYCKRIIDKSPLAAYHKWNELLLFKDEPTNPRHLTRVVDEGADLYAQFRALGYEKTTFLSKRIVNLLRLFGRGEMPSSEADV